VQLIDSFDHHIMNLGERLHVSSPPHPTSPFSAAARIIESLESSGALPEVAPPASALVSNSESEATAPNILD
jgi:hypothetical protein